jgi:glucose uptake protein GlcU
MTIALKEMEIGAVYAIWSAVGTALVALLGVLIFHEPANVLKVVAIALIIVGVVCLNLSSRRSEKTVARSTTELRSELRLDHRDIATTKSAAASRAGSGAVQPATGR